MTSSHSNAAFNDQTLKANETINNNDDGRGKRRISGRFLSFAMDVHGNGHALRSRNRT